MNKADVIFKDNIKEILINGYTDENPRSKYKSDEQPAHSIYITQVCEKYDLSKGEFPITELRPIPIKNGINEIRWIYQDQTADLSKLEGEYGIKWWRDWEVGDSNSIGQRYGATVSKYNLMNNLMVGLVTNPFGRRHIVDLWQEEDFQQTKGLPPCAFQTMFSVRKVEDRMYLDMTLTQRSSDYLVAGHINKMQYVAFMMMVAKACGYKCGVFTHFVQNLHIYDRHQDLARQLLRREPHSSRKPILLLNVKDGTNFYNITADDFELIDYYPIKPNLKFDLGI